MNASDIVQRHAALEAEKERLQVLMDQINQFFSPTDAIYSNNEKVGLANSTQKGELLDITGTQVMDEYVSNVLGLYFNTEVSWFRIEMPEFDISEPDAKVLNERAKLLYRLISKSNYYAVSPQHEWDNLVQGHGMMIIEKDKNHFARCYTKNPRNILFVQNEANDVIETYWSTDFTKAAFIDKWPHMLNSKVFSEDTESGNPLSTVRVVYSVLPNNELYAPSDDEFVKTKFKGDYIYRAIIVSGRGTATPSNSLADKFKSFFKKKYTKDNYNMIDIEKPIGIKKGRFTACRNKPARNTPYGDGEGKRALVKARILNKLTRDIIKSAGITANPPIAVDESLRKQFLNSNEIEEGRLVFKSLDELSGRSGNALETLRVDSNIAGILEAYRLQQEQLANMLPTTSQTYKVSRQSIQEIQQRLRDQEKRLNPIRAHYLKEGVTVHLRRFYQIAKEQGYFKKEEYQFNDPNLENKEIEFDFNALMLQSHRITKALLINQALGQSQNLLAINPSLSIGIDGKKALSHIWAGSSSLEFLKTDEEVAQEEQEILQRQQQQDDVAQQSANAQNLEAGSSAFANMAQALGISREPQ